MLRRRRALGLSFATAHTIHLGALITFNRLAGEVPSAVTLVAGGGAYLMMFAMAATSNDASVRRLGRNWVRLHKLGIYWLWFIFTFSYAGRVFGGNPEFAPFLALRARWTRATDRRGAHPQDTQGDATALAASRRTRREAPALRSRCRVGHGRRAAAARDRPTAHEFPPIASYVDDLIAGALLLVAARAASREQPNAEVWLAGAWGVLAGGLYGSFFWQLAQWREIDVSGHPASSSSS